MAKYADKTKYTDNLRRSAELFGALSQPSRLLLLRLIWNEPLSGERLTELSGLSAGTVSHHLSELRNAGLIITEQSGYWRLHRARKKALDISLAGIVTGQTPPPTTGQLPTQPRPPAQARPLGTEPVEQHVDAADTLKAVMPYGKVQVLPRKKVQRAQVLAALTEAFERGRDYTETEVNIRLSGHEVDPATLRRALIRGGWLSRAGELYQRTD